ncbi:NAD(P)-binding protein [Saccharata proteae CBS 121410]|uniref:NAD(P)-binding protein n=1 Tax=Saccharata proteae CBS 121410 TaxID=1314787 RepID=A0A9P4HSZ8_9PEZI|nr:NAD(P)-binding protein [Saccharata proteae CBS 121410]
MSASTIAIVSGANRGIGFGIVQTLVQSYKQPLVLYAASRAGVNLQIKPPSPDIQVKYPKLDVADPASIKSLAQMIEQEHGGCDILINNAGVNLDNRYNPDNVRQTLDINYRGTLHMCQQFIPLMKPNGRIVNISSIGGDLTGYSKSLQDRFRSSSMTLKDLEALAQEYQHSANNSTEQQDGWPPQSYKVSKSCINALTAVLHRENPGLIINACCPGWVSTDMGKMVGKPRKTIEEGARIPVRLATGDIGGVSGRYWGNPSIMDTGYGDVVEW